MASIAASIAARYGLDVQTLRARTRRHDISHPRQHAMAAMREQRRTDGKRRYSLQQIANYFGVEAHSTVGYAARIYAKRQRQARLSLHRETVDRYEARAGG